MSRPRKNGSVEWNKSISRHLFDVCEDGYHVGLNHVLQFQRHNDSPNVSIQSRLVVRRKSVSINTVIEGVFL